jgi:hypothetical protein
MSKITVSSQQDLYKLKTVTKVYDEVTVRLHQLKHQGLIRHAVKYANNALKVGGTLIIDSTPFESYSLRRNKVDFWQVRHEVFGCLKNTVDVVDVNSKEGRITLRKSKHLYDYDGVSFGIVFSGNKQEEPLLVAAIRSIPVNQKVPCEILVCGPSGYNFDWIKKEFLSLNFKYLPLDIATTPRLLICDKKNLLYSSAAYSLVVISHCRIIFSDNFTNELLKYPIEMATPAVYYVEKKKEFKYLDISFINNYQEIQYGASRRGTIAGENIDSDYLHWYRKRVPFIDGGLNIFNKNLIKEPPYNSFISWGEAEDVDVCNRLFQQGVLIDFLPDIKCYSATNKLTGYSWLRKLGRKLFGWLNKNA